MVGEMLGIVIEELAVHHLGFVEPFQSNIFRDSGLLTGVIGTPVAVGAAARVAAQVATARCTQ